MAQAIDRRGLDTLFFRARSVRKWMDKPVSDELLKRVLELTILGPTSGNCCPSRFVFIVSAEARERLLPHLSENNQVSTRTAPVTAIVATDSEFWREMEPASKFTGTFANMGPPAWDHGLRNGTLQGAYLMLAARALGAPRLPDPRHAPVSRTCRSRY
jgi:3-hydroxypropanoate dehydrogenase